MRRLTVTTVTSHERGKIYHINVKGRAVQVLVTFHVFERAVLWRLSTQSILQTLLFPKRYSVDIEIVLLLTAEYEATW